MTTTTTAMPAVRLSRPGTPFWKTKLFGRWVHDIVVYSLLIALSLLFAFPFFWMLTSALKPEYQIYIWPPQWIPDPIQWSNFVEAFSNPLLPFHIFFRNTLILEAGIITGRLLSCILVAYGFARLDAPGKNLLFVVLLGTLMLPGVAIQIPRFILFNELGWVNSFKPLIVPMWFGEAYAIFLMRQFFLTIPRELEEAARIDGANTLQVIRHVIVPLSMPVIVVVAILSFKDIWNDFFTPLLYLNDSSKYPLAVGLAYFNGQYDAQMNLLMAASVAMLMPLVIVFFIAQRAFVEGISLTGLTGR